MRDNTRASLAFKLGTHAARGPELCKHASRNGELARDAAPTSPHRHISCRAGCATFDVSMARVRDAPWHRLSGGFRISFPKLLLYLPAGDAAQVLSTKDLVLTQRSRTAFELDI